MPLLSTLYDRALIWSRHRHGTWYLGALSFAESSFFPVPPDIMLAPMCLARLKDAWKLAFITTLASVVGGLLGYVIGYAAFDVVEPYLISLGYEDKITLARAWFMQWGAWVLFIAGFTPIPYKLFTISAGAVSMALFPFVLASLIGRGARFFLVAGFMVWGGERMEHAVRKYIDRLGWLVIALVLIAYIGYRTNS